MAQKILFLHGFFASGTCIPALALKEYFSGKATVLSPDLPLHPQEALDFIQRLCNQEQPDILVGNSNGSFLAQIVASKNNIPALLGNPHFEMTRFLMERIGSHEYKSPRANGNQQLVINQILIDEFAELQQHQWDNCQVANQENIWGIFGENDHLAHFEPLFLMHYHYCLLRYVNRVQNQKSTDNLLLEQVRPPRGRTSLSYPLLPRANFRLFS